MRRARIRDPAGTVRSGRWTDDGIVAAGRVYDPDEVTVLAPVEPTKVLGIHSNYRRRFDSPDEFPARPRLFWKGGPNVVADPGSTVALPDGTVAFEPELGVVIGEQCRNVAVDDAMDAVAGFTCVHDLSDRSRENEFRQKSFDGAAPLGPVVAPPASVPETPRIRARVNGEPRLDVTDAFVYSVPEVVASVAGRVTLEPDDVIAMGNPGGSEPLEDGDAVAIEIEGVGRLEHDVAVRS